MPSFVHPPLPYAGPLLPRSADQMKMGRLGRLTFICAPAGYGKSVLISNWAQANPERSVIWFNAVRRYDDGEILRTFLDELSGLTGASVQHDALDNPEEIAELARSYVQRFDASVTMIMDGLHHLRGEEPLLQESLRIFIERQPENLAVIVSSRNNELRGAEVARIQGRLDLIDQESLKIGEAEFTKAVVDRGLSRAQAIEMYRLIDGWPAAVGLLLAMPRMPVDIEEFRLAVVSGGMLTYLTEAILKELPRDVREAVLVTSIAEVVSPDLAIALGLSSRQAGSLLELQRYGIPSSDLKSGKFVSLHDLFRMQLMKTLYREDPQRAEQLRRQYAEYLLSKNDPRAIDQLIAVGDIQAAQELLDRQIMDVVEAGDVRRVQEWIRALESQYSDQIEKLKKRIYGKLLDNDLLLAESLLDSLKDELQQFNTDDPFSLGFYHLAQAWISLNYGDLESAYQHAKLTASIEMDPAHPREHDYHETAQSYIATYKIFVESVPESDDEIDRFMKGANRGAPSWKDMTMPSFRAHLALQRGEFRRAHSMGLQAMGSMPETLRHSVYFPWPALLGLVGALREQGKAEEAIDLIDQHKQEILRFHSLAYTLEILSVYAAALVDLGRTTEASDTFSEVRALVESYGRGWWIKDRLDFQEARFLLRHGDESRARQLASRLRDPAAVSLATLELDLESASRRASQTLATLRRESALDEMNFRLFSALLAKETPNTVDQHLRYLLPLMEEHGAMRVVVDRGRTAVDLVSLFVGRHPSRFGESLVVRMQNALTSATPNVLVAPLSKREQEILNLLASPMALKEIAESLFVSHNTLKTHLRHLYRKMQVSGRDQAVARGKKLLLLV